MQLAPHGLAHLAAPIHTRFGDRSMAILHEDPYRLTEVDGVGFARADKIALAADVPPESSRRAQAAAVYALAEAEQQGNTYLPLAELTQRTAKLIGLQPDPDVLERGARADRRRRPRLPRADPRQRDRRCADAGAPRRRPAPPRSRPRRAPPQDDEARAHRRAVGGGARRLRSRISVLTGGPGVGKTACTRAIVAEAEAADLRIALCAPTGRAARRLEEATGHEAQTIHRMLEWMPGREPAFKPGHPLPADLVIVDESSMLNLRLIEVLLGGLAESTHIVFVGDADQLPPIGAGKPFEDLIASGVAPVVRLTQIFRQAARSMITTAAHEINQGRAAPPRARRTDQDHDFFFIERPNPERALETVVEVVAERAPNRFGVDPIRDVQVLAPMYRGPVGIDALNERLQARLNPSGKRALGDRFRIGDRLIQTRNSHELGLMNGSIVFLRDDDPDEEEIVVDTDEGGSLAIPYGETATLRLAYAISVHKAQGCEVPVVVGVCHRSHARMLTRPLLYTAITRARSSCVLVGDPAALAAAVAARRQRRPPLRPRRAPARLAGHTPRMEDRRRRGRRWPQIAITLAGVALLGGLVLAVPALHDAVVAAFHGDTAECAAQLDSLGVAGPLLIIALALIHAVVFYPAEIVDAAAGFAYGFFPALALMMFGLAALGDALLRDRALGGAPPARPLARRRALRADRGDDRTRRRHPAARGAADPDRPLQPHVVTRRARPGSRSGASSGRPRSATCRSPRSRSTSAPGSKA